MARKRKQRESCETSIDFTPLIDCAFNLLIFFILTLKFSTTEGQLSAELPKDVGTSRSYAPPPENKPLKIFIQWSEERKEAKITAAQTTVTFPGKEQDRRTLLNEIALFVRPNPEKLIVEISPLRNVPYAFLVLVLDVATHAGAKNINFSGVAEMDVGG